MKTQAFAFSILTVEHPAERVLRAAFLTLMGVLFVAYVYFVSASVFHIIARKEAHMFTTETSASTASLEAEYYVRTEGMTLSRAETLGLLPVEGMSYVRRTTRLGQAAAANGVY